MTKMDFEFFNQLVVDHDLPPAVEAEMIKWFQKRNVHFCPKKWRKAMEQRQAKQRLLIYGE